MNGDGSDATIRDTGRTKYYFIFRPIQVTNNNL